MKGSKKDVSRSKRAYQPLDSLHQQGYSIMAVWSIFVRIRATSPQRGGHFINANGFDPAESHFAKRSRLTDTSKNESIRNGKVGNAYPPPRHQRRRRTLVSKSHPQNSISDLQKPPFLREAALIPHKCSSCRCHCDLLSSSVLPLPRVNRTHSTSSPRGLPSTPASSPPDAPVFARGRPYCGRAWRPFPPE